MPLPGILLLSSIANAAPLDPLAFTALAPVLDPSGPVTVDTDGPTLSYDGTQVNGVLEGGVAVFTFGEVVLDEVVNAEGDAPLAILSHGDLRVEGEIRAYARGSSPGPGGYRGGTAAAGQSGGGPGGGQSTPGAGGGGFGGPGGDSQRGGDGGSAYGDLASSLEGGSGGAKCTRITGENGDGGGGGGAIELGAVGRLDVAAGALISVDGGDGQSTQVNGGGGGSGGAIALHGNGGTCAGALSARGGAGGEDGSSSLYAEGGGGGGGQIAMISLETECVTDVSGGPGPRGGGGNGGDGVVTFIQWEDPDADQDGWTVGEGDCDDADPDVNPGAEEVAGDGVDSDCDGEDSAEPGQTTEAPTGTDPTGTDPTDPGPGDGPPDGGDPVVGEELVVGGGCGCDGSGGAAPWALGLGLLLARRRSR